MTPLAAGLVAGLLVTAVPGLAAPELRARLETRPPAQVGARFVVRARLEPGSALAKREPTIGEPAATLHLDARLIANADACVAPGAIFRDGFELP